MQYILQGILPLRDLLDPAQNICLRCHKAVRVEVNVQSALYLCAGTHLRNILKRMSQPAAVCGKRVDHLSGKILVRQKCAHCRGKCIPPDRCSQDNGVILAEVGGNRFQFRFKTAVDLTLSLVYDCVIAAGIRSDGLDFAQIGACLLLNQLCDTACVAAVGLKQYQCLHAS